METIVEDYIDRDYQLREQGEMTAMLQRRSWGTASGHILCAVLTAWWTLGIGNIIYACICHSTGDKVRIKVTHQPTNRLPSAEPVDTNYLGC